MKKLFHSILSKNRNRRNLAVATALWLLRQIRDVEEDEMCRHKDMLDKLPGSAAEHEYAVIENEYFDCGHALDALEYVIENLNLEYCAGRF